MGRSQNVRKWTKTASVFSRKISGRLGTPAQKSDASSSTKIAGRTREIDVANNVTKKGNFRTPIGVSEHRKSLRLSPIHESSYQDHNEYVASSEKVDRPPPLHWKEIGSCSDASRSTNRDSTSDMIMPSGVSSFLLDCMDMSSPNQSSTDSSLPSPEVFRRADDGGEEVALDISVEDLFKPQVKNSTLLDASHAVDIAMRHPPNISSILEVSKLDESTLEKGNKVKVNMPGVGPPTGENMVRAPFKQPKKIERTRPMKCRKKVTFHASVLREELQKEENGTEPCGPMETEQAVGRKAGVKKGRGFSAMNSDLQLVEQGLSSSMVLLPEDDDDDDDGDRSCKQDTRKPACEAYIRPARFFDFKSPEEKEAVLHRKSAKPLVALTSKPPITNLLPVRDQLGPVYVKFKNSEVHIPDELHEVCWIQLAQEGENFFRNPSLKKVTTEQGVFYEDYGKVRKFPGQVFYPL